MNADTDNSTPGGPGGSKGPSDQSHAEPAGENRDAPGADGLDVLIAKARECIEHFAHWFEANVDLARIRIRRVVVGIVAVFLGAVLCLVIGVVSVVYAIRGGAGALSDLADAPPWFGQVAMGVLGIGGVLAVTWFVSYAGRAKRMRKWVAKYEPRRASREARQNVNDREAAGHAA
jgi:hypothetical protein